VPLETLEDLTELLAYLHAHAASVGRTTPIDVMCVLPGPAADAADADTIATVKRLAEVGVTWLAVNGKGETPDEARAFIERFGSRVIGQV
jgi:hypothetical protein